MKISARADLGGIKPAHDRCIRNNADSARPDSLEKTTVVMAHPDTVVGNENRSIFHADAYVKQFKFQNKITFNIKGLVVRIYYLQSTVDTGYNDLDRA